MNNQFSDEVRRDAPRPLYQQLVSELKKKMKEMAEHGETLLPSERELCRLYSVSHTTVRLALKELEISGLLLRVPGKGTFLEEPAKDKAPATPVYGVILEDISSGKATDFRLRLLAGIRTGARNAAVSLMLIGEEDEIFMKLARSGRLAGLVITNPMLAEYRLRELKRMNLPLVTIGRPPMRGISWVDNDNVAVGCALTEHLVQRGCRRIGFIGLDRSYMVTADRLAGYKAAIKKAGMTAGRKLISFCGRSGKAGYSQAAELLEAGADGLVCMDDLTAMGALHKIHETGRKCPEEIAVAGCNNSSFAEYSLPPLTSVDIMPEKIGSEAVLILEELRRNPGNITNRFIPFQLVVRQSTGC